MPRGFPFLVWTRQVPPFYFFIMSNHTKKARQALAKELAELREMMTPESIELQRQRADEDILHFFAGSDQVAEPTAEYGKEVEL